MTTPSETSVVPGSPGQPAKGSTAFLVTSLVFLCCASLWLAIQPGLLLDPKMSTHTTAWLYLVVFGVAFPGVYGVVYRAMPIIFGVPLYSTQFVVLHLAFHLAGLFIAVPMAFQPDLPHAMLGQSFLACGAIVFIVNVWGSFKLNAMPDASAAFIACSLLWLAVSLMVGMPFSKAPLFPFLAKGDWSTATFELALGGFVINTILGLALKTTALRLGSDVERTNTPWFALSLTNAAIAWLFAATIYGPAEFVIFCLVVYLAGALAYLGRFLSILGRRESEVLEWDGKILFTSLCMLPVALALLGWDVWVRRDPANASPQLDAAAVLSTLLGVAVPAIIALLYQTVALTRGALVAGSLKERVASQVLLAAFFNYAIGFLLIVPGSWLAIEKMVTLGTLFLSVGSIGFLANLLFILRPASTESRDPVRVAA